ncbi:hypothetical protein J1605_007625 [Eschrichtius robustus]|uniref:Uncharacterized protein n=1 Tax=Eschrichtius robustus TaxID=9764 RepID=A0AB34H055_ESCRO|nr:hypothetical protein J1605_007625 [Eschrichtius robustus]
MEKEQVICPSDSENAQKKRDCFGTYDVHQSVARTQGLLLNKKNMIVSALVKIMQSSMGIIYKDMATKMLQEITLNGATDC